MGCIYDLTLKNLPQKVSQRFSVVSGVLNNISKYDRAKSTIFKMASKMAAKSLKFPLFAHYSLELTHFDALSLVLSLIWYIVYFTHNAAKI